jgi:hypothetical protein
MLKVKLPPLKRHAGTAVCGSGLATPSTRRTTSRKETWHPLYGRLGWPQEWSGDKKIFCPRQGKQTRTTYSSLPTNEKFKSPTSAQPCKFTVLPITHSTPPLLCGPQGRTEDTTLIHTLMSVRFPKTQVKRRQEWTEN